MRTYSVGMLKGNAPVSTGLPREGSKTRLVYDTLYECRGASVTRDDWRALADLCGGYNKLARAVHDLRDYYGCDIRGHVLLGEWHGRAYIDYTEAAEEAARCR